MSRSYWLNILAVEFVRSVDGGLVPVGPVDPILEGCDGERMPQVIRGVEDDAAT